MNDDKKNQIQIPLVDLKRQYTFLKEDIDKAIMHVLETGHFIIGEEVTLFEKEFAAYNKITHCVSLNSGTDALLFALEALGIGKGDEVIVPANTFVATAFAVTSVGATPVFVDVDPSTFTITAKNAQEKITTKTKAIIPVHLYGRSVDMDPLLTLAKEHNLYIIEDACQAHGAYYKGKRVGTFGIVGCFSFYPGKNLGAYGDGGAIITNDPNIAKEITMLRQYGEEKKYQHNRYGRNSRLDTIQAAVLRVKLKYLDQWNAYRIKNARNYHSALSPFVPALKTPELITDGLHVYHLYVIRSKNRNALQEHLRIHGIATGIHYPIPLHLQKAYASLGYKEGDFPFSELLSQEILSLPIFPELTEEEINAVAGYVSEFVK